MSRLKDMEHGGKVNFLLMLAESYQMSVQIFITIWWSLGEMSFLLWLGREFEISALCLTIQGCVLQT